MRSLRLKFALLVGSAAVLVVMAAGALFWSLQAADGAIERTLAAQSRLDLLADLSGRLTQYGLAAVDAAGAQTPQPERVAAARADVDRAMAAVGARLGVTIADTDGILGRTEFAGRSRLLARLGAAVALLDRQVGEFLREPDPAQRSDEVRGALNAFGAITGPSLSALVDAERRGVEQASAAARALSDTLRIASLAAAAAALAAVGLMHRAITRPLFARIEAIRRAASAVGHGELDTRLSDRGRDELGLLVASFNRMAARLGRRERRVAADRAALEETIAARTADLTTANERLAKVDQSRRRFFADVSHELRTPLTVILGECDLAARTPTATADGLRATLATIRARAQRLHRRVEDLLRVARSESGQLELDVKPVEALGILVEAVASSTAEAKRRRIALELSPGPHNLEIAADPEWLRQVVEGLIDNALRHARGARRILVALEATRHGGAISVTDDGSGFPEDADRLVERFAREPGGSGETGFGIGLALAAWIVERHDGRMRLGRGEGGTGARVTIELPAWTKENAA